MLDISPANWDDDVVERRVSLMEDSTHSGGPSDYHSRGEQVLNLAGVAFVVSWVALL
jgi:hypothetical protein